MGLGHDPQPQGDHNAAQHADGNAGVLEPPEQGPKPADEDGEARQPSRRAPRQPRDQPSRALETSWMALGVPRRVFSRNWTGVFSISGTVLRHTSTGPFSLRTLAMLVASSSVSSNS